MKKSAKENDSTLQTAKTQEKLESLDKRKIPTKYIDEISENQFKISKKVEFLSTDLKKRA